jgi:FixJ family two-component response regulator
MPPPTKVAVIDDDASMRKALVRLIKSAGIEGAAFLSACEFLDDPVYRQMDCAVTD